MIRHRAWAATAYYTAHDPPPFQHAPLIVAEPLTLDGFTFPTVDRSKGPDHRALMVYEAKETFADAIARCRAALAEHFAATGETYALPAMSGDVVTDLYRLADAMRHHATHSATEVGHPAVDDMAIRLMHPDNLHRHPERYEPAIRAFCDAFNHHLGHRVRLES